MKKILCLLSLFWIGTMSGQSLWERDPGEVRNSINERIMAISADTAPVESVVDLEVALSTPIRIYRPTDEQTLPAILFIHGGAWVAGNLDTHDNLARLLCSETGSIVVSVCYLNAREGKFPLPLEQCYEALQWAMQNLNPPSLIVVGDSAGGNLAAALCLMTRDRGGPAIDAQVLINPATDLSYGIEQKNDPFDSFRWQTKQYLTDPKDGENRYVSPLRAEDLRGLPEALIVLAEYDLLREMGQKFADRLSAAGVPTTVFCQKGVDHLAGHGARASEQAKESLDYVIHWVNQRGDEN
ncbi:MAG: alpha/beta hydrolase [Verrucomicrobia bacterium]|nr:alpha/beta hydrolase [Verrucomicrobiota bacterium]